jgi:hypothetical protein
MSTSQVFPTLSELNAHVFHQGANNLLKSWGNMLNLLARADQWLHWLETGLTDLSSFECVFFV